MRSRLHNKTDTWKLLPTYWEEWITVQRQDSILMSLDTLRKAFIIFLIFLSSLLSSSCSQSFPLFFLPLTSYNLLSLPLLSTRSWAQVGLKITTQLTMTSNFWSFCLCSESAGITGLLHPTCFNVVPRMEPRASCALGRCSSSGATPPVIQACKHFWSLIWGQEHGHCGLYSTWQKRRILT